MKKIEIKPRSGRMVSISEDKVNDRKREGSKGNINNNKTRTTIETGESEVREGADDILEAEERRYPIHPDTSYIDELLIEPEIPVEEEREYGIGTSLYIFPELEDPGLDKALYETFERETIYDESGVQRYIESCKELNVIPSRNFTKSLQGEYVNFRYYGLDPKALNPICTALKYNKSVKVMDLESNCVTPDGASHLTDLLKENTTLLSLNLTGCKIGPEAARRLVDGVTFAQSLIDLNLSWNKLNDESFAILAQGFQENCSIKTLNLSNNKLSTNTAILLGDILEESWALNTLDLSWNILYPPEGLRTMFIGLGRNIALTSLNLQGNALGGQDTAMLIRECLYKNRILLHLDISHNRLSDEVLLLLRQGIMRNDSLLTLHVGYNPISPEGAYILLEALQYPTPVLELLDLEDIWVRKPFLELKEVIRKERTITVNYRGVLSNYEIQGPDKKKLLLERAKFEAERPKKKILKRDMGHFLLKLEAETLDRTKFIDKLNEQKVKLSDSLKQALVETFQDAKQPKKVDVVGMRDYYLILFPGTELPQRKPKEKKKKAKEGMKPPKK